jgi:acyl-CoA thioesterase FadM
MLSKWPVLLFLPVQAGDVDGDGLLTEAACERFFAAGREAYFELSTTIDADQVTVVETSPPRRAAPVDPDGQVSISVSVTELFPDRFVMAARVRPEIGDAIAADLRCVVSAGEVTTAVRDDLIAIAHAAPHWH